MKHRFEVSHGQRVKRKQDRLAGLSALYATYEQVGWNPADNKAMRELKDKIYSLRAQLKVMGTDVEPCPAMREGKRHFPTAKRERLAA